MAQTGRKENRGGARAGAGRKKETLSVRQVKAMLSAAKKKAKEHGRSIDDVLLELIYEGSDTNKLAAIKLFKTFTMAQMSEGGDIDRQAASSGPAVYLPQQRADEGKVVPIGPKAGQSD